MSTSTVPRPSRVAVTLGMIATLVGGSIWIAAPVIAAGPGTGEVRTPVGEITPLALTHGLAQGGNQPAFAQPFRTLDAGQLRAAKLHAAAVASRGQRGPLQAPHTPLAGIFNNTNSGGLNQLTVAPPDSTGSIGPNHYVEMINQQIGVYDRSLTLLGSSDNGAFMGAPTGLTVTDPQIQWDGQGGTGSMPRWAWPRARTCSSSAGPRPPIRAISTPAGACSAPRAGSTSTTTRSSVMTTTS